MLSKDDLLGLFTAFFGLLVIFYMVPQGVDMEEVEAGTSILVRPDFWPYVLGVLLFLSGGMYVVSSRWRFTNNKATEDQNEKSYNIGAWQVAAVFLLAILFGLTSDSAGLVLPAMLIFFISSLAFGRDLLLTKIIGSILVPLLLMVFFEYVANIPIPIGVLENIVN